jgi:DNA-directed RNA polymerase specialized sigma24 family protein
MDDREIVSAMKAGALPTLAGLGGAYDRYAAPLFDYCYGILGDREDAASATRDAFLREITEFRGIRKPRLMRAQLYAAARDECRRRQQSVPTASRRRPPAGDQQANLCELISSAFAGLNGLEREAAELMFNHGLSDSDLAIVLGVSRHRASALATRAQGYLEATLAIPIVAHICLRTCPDLRELLPGWDGRLEDETRALVESHIEQCEICMSTRYQAFQPAIAYALEAPFPPPASLRREVIALSVAAPRKAPRSRQVMWMPESASSASRARLGVALAVAAIVIWVVAAISATLLTILGSHSAHGLITVRTDSLRADSLRAAAEHKPGDGNHRPF